MKLKKILFSLVIIGVVACSSTDEPTDPVGSETATNEPTATAASESSSIVSGRTPEGNYFLGAEDAPVTMIDYSDFL